MSLDRVREALESAIRDTENGYRADPRQCREALSDLTAHEKEDAERENQHKWETRMAVERLEFVQAQLATHEAKRVAYRNQAVDDYAAILTQLQELLEAAKGVRENLPMCREHECLTCTAAVNALDRVIKNIEGKVRA